MAVQNAFNTALTRCGFNVNTTEAIINEGFDTLDTLATVDEDDIDSMIKNVRETRGILGAAAQGNVNARIVGETHDFHHYLIRIFWSVS